jgi:hypothetical protein
MESLTRELIQKLLSVDKAPCLSLYMPTHRNHPENLQDSIRFKKLVKKMGDSLLLKYSADEVQKHLDPYENLGDDSMVWSHPPEG